MAAAAAVVGWWRMLFGEPLKWRWCGLSCCSALRFSCFFACAVPGAIGNADAGRVTLMHFADQH